MSTRMTFGHLRGCAGRRFRRREGRSDAGGGERPATTQGRVQLQDVRFTYPARPDVPVLLCTGLTDADPAPRLLRPIDDQTADLLWYETKRGGEGRDR